MRIHTSIKGAAVAMAIVGLGAVTGTLALQVACSGKSQDKDTPSPAISAFYISTDPKVLTNTWSTTLTTVSVKSGGTVYLMPRFAATNGSAVINPGNLAVPTSNRPITVPNITQATTFTLTVTAANGQTVSQAVNVSVVPAPDATITAPASATRGATGLAASVKTQAGSSYLWSISNGTITGGQGTPAITFTAGSSAADGHSQNLGLTCKVTSSAGDVDTKTATVVVNAIAPSGLAYSAPAASYLVGTPISANSPSFAGGDPVYSYTVAPSLPAGLAMNASTGVITGTPTTATPTATYTVTATNSGGSTQGTLSITVAALPTIQFTANPTTISVGQSSFLSWTVDPTAVASVSIDQGVPGPFAIPMGTKNVAPTVTTTYTLTANLVGGGTQTKTATVTVGAPASFSISSFAADQSQVDFGGFTTLRWALSSNPDSLTLNGSSVLGATSAQATPARRQTYTLAGQLGSQTDSKSLVVAARGLDALAGSYVGAGSADGTGTNASFYQPVALSADAAGNVYTVEYGNHTVRMITPAGVTTTLAGAPGQPGFVDSANGSPLFNKPQGIAVMPDGNTIYVQDSGNYAIRKMVKNGTSWVVSTLAGGAQGNADGLGAAAQFNAGSGSMVLDPTGQYLYLAEYAGNRIRQIKLADGNVLTYAGSTSGKYGHTDVTTPAILLGDNLFNNPSSVAFSKDGKSIYITESYTYCIRMMSYNGPVTIAGATGTLLTVAGKPNTKGTTDGTGAGALFSSPAALTVDANGGVWIADTGNHTIRYMTVSGGLGTVTTPIGLAGKAGAVNGPTASATLSKPEGLVFVGNTLYIGEYGNSDVRAFAGTSAGGTVTSLAGAVVAVGSANGVGAAASFNYPGGLAVDAARNTYVADTLNSTIRKIAPDGTTTTFAGTAGTSGNTDGAAALFNKPLGLAADPSGNIYVADYGNKAIRKIQPNGYTVTLLNTTLAGPESLVVSTVDPNLLYVLDNGSAIYEVSISTGAITKTIGGTSGYADGPAANAKFKATVSVLGNLQCTPGLTMDAAGNMYLADRGNYVIRKIAAGSFTVSTIAGLTTSYGFIDGPLGTNQFNSPCGIVVDKSGNLYVADAKEHAIRKIDPTGNVTTLVGAYTVTASATDGIPTKVGAAPGLLGSTAGLYNPTGLAITPDGDLIVTTNGAVMQVTAP